MLRNSGIQPLVRDPEGRVALPDSGLVSELPLASALPSELPLASALPSEMELALPSELPLASALPSEMVLALPSELALPSVLESASALGLDHSRRTFACRCSDAQLRPSQYLSLVHPEHMHPYSRLHSQPERDLPCR